MPPASSTASTSAKFKANRFSTGTSPDSEPSLPEPIPTVSSKKKKKNAASKQTQNIKQEDRTSTPDIAGGDTVPVVRPQTILSQIGHGFPIPARRDSPILDLEDDDDVATTGKVSDQYTPPNDTWLEDDVYGKNPPAEPISRTSRNVAPLIEPGFSTKTRYDSKSPPISPPQRYVRPVSYGGGIPPVPALPRGSPSGYGYSPTSYGSPPAPHLPQPHFYHAQDVNLGLPRSNAPQIREEPTSVRHTKLALKNGGSRDGVLLGFDRRLNIMCIDNGMIDEIGVLEGIPGIVIDAILLEWGSGIDPYEAVRPLVAVVVHGPREIPAEMQFDGPADETRPSNQVRLGQQVVEYTTRVEVYSMSTQERLAVFLETPGQAPQSAFRGAPPTPPHPIGQLKLHASGTFVTVSSGVSGEVYVFTLTMHTQPEFECLGKFWTTIQPQIQRRDSSHQSSDADISPADVGRAEKNTERAIITLKGRWLAISPASSPSRPSIGALVGPSIVCGRHTGIESMTAQTRPSVTCEVESPDADTLIGKVARGVAQELVKGAKWLGDQGYQTWQSYWRKDQSPSASGNSPAFSPPMQPLSYPQNAFPPTHGETSRSSREPELVAIYDLQALHEATVKKGVDEIKPLATFQPPRGCSYLSFAPHGLNLLTTGRKGDVQYIWDLMQIKHCRTQVTTIDDERVRLLPRVRQIAKYERLSGSTVVDVIWDLPTGSRFAVLTKNKTIHLFDLPSNAFKWPPPRYPRKLRPSSKSMDSTQHDTQISSGFFASAMNIANQAPPMIANWRGRTPSMGGGLAGIGQTGIGIASATGAMGGKAVAAGLSKSLGAASETVSQIRHAGENRLHLRTYREASSGKLFWIMQGRRSCLAIIEADSLKQYQVRKEKRDREDVTVFAARKAVTIKFPPSSRLTDDRPVSRGPTTETADQKIMVGFWKARSSGALPSQAFAHPLSFAEIETNAPYQPFHSDRRVVLSVFSDARLETDSQLPAVTSVSKPPAQGKSKSKSLRTDEDSTQWVFGDDIPSITLNISRIQVPDDDDDHTGSVIYRETVQVTSPTSGNQDMDQIVSTTRRRKVKKGQSSADGGGSDVEKEDGFFEDDCDVLDFATDRV